MLKDEIEKRAFRYAVQNRLKYGQAKPGPVVNKVLGLYPELRERAREVYKVIEEVIARVNELSIEELRELAQEIGVSEEGDKRECRKALPPLPNLDKWKVVRTRFAPNPDFPIHLGNARAAILSHEYARMYGGQFILRFEDTDPRLKRPLPEAYVMIKEDLKWLGLKWDEEYIQSLRMERYYGVVKRLLELGAAYVDLCDADTFKMYRNAGKACPHRNSDPATCLELFDKMLEGGYREGEAVVRLKTDLSHPDPSVRDWVVMRIVDTSKYPHPLVGDKYRVWPTYNFAAAIDDALMGVTHILRGKEHATNTVKQLFLYKYMGWQYPEVINFGRVGLEGLILSKSWIKRRIASAPEKFMGFDDIRFGTIAALRRRGIEAEAIRQLILELGLSSVDARVSWSNIAAINRKILDERVKRVFVVCDPVKLVIKGLAVPTRVEVPFHPSKSLGTRVLPLERPEVYISRKDLEVLREGGVLRLMEFANVRLERVNEGMVEVKCIGTELQQARELGAPIVQWVPEGFVYRVLILRADGMRLRAERCLGERTLEELKVGEVVQMVRLGFGRVDSKGRGLVRVIFAHE